jgi:hypothetical protein
VKAITMDPNELDDAAGALRGIFATLEGSARDLDGAGVGVEMPGALAARVATEVSSIAASLRRAADSLADMPGDLARRAQLGRLADTISQVYKSEVAASLPANIIAAQYAKELKQVADGSLPARSVTVGASAGELARKLQGAAKAGGWVVRAVDLGGKTAGDLRNPYLDDSQRAANVTALAGMSAATAAAGTAAAAGAAALGAPVVVPALVGVGVGIGLSVLDEKIGATDWVADRTDDVIDAGADAVSDVADDLGQAWKFAGGIL